jgi:hypothetical protein
MTTKSSNSLEATIASNTTAKTKPDSGQAGLNKGVIAGIVIGSVVGLVLLCILAFMVGRCTRSPLQNKQSIDIALQDKPFVRIPSPIPFPIPTTVLSEESEPPSFQSNSFRRTSMSETTVAVPPLVSEVKERQRRERQTGIQAQLRQIELDIIDIQMKLIKRRGLGKRLVIHERHETKAELQAQLTSLQFRLRSVEEAQRSDWAQALTDIPPAGYGT